MPHQRSTRRSVYIVPLVFGLAILPLLGLLWATYVLFAQERALEQQRRSERLSRTADLIAGELQTALSNAERALTLGQESWPGGAVAATLHRDHLVVKPAGHVRRESSRSWTQHAATHELWVIKRLYAK